MATNTNILPARYRAPKLIAQGGMGEIYRATDDTLGRAVAVKVLAERFAQDEPLRERFTREALAAARLSGEPNTVTIFDVGEWGGRPFIVMEYFSGGSLDEQLRGGGPQEPGQVLDWLEQAARALDAAHRNGVVHRDVKPGNLLLDRDGNVHVADFGIASAAGMDSMTSPGTVLGTAGYLSPEQARGDRAGAESDRYALAVVAYELLTGRRPFAAESPTAEAAAHIHKAVPSVCDTLASLPRELDPVFEQALAKEPGGRYASCAEFVADLRHALHEAAGSTHELAVVPVVPRTPYRRSGFSAWPLLVLGALVALGIVLAVALTRGGGRPAAQTVLRTVTTQGQVSTVMTTAPATASTPAPAASQAPSGASGAQLNDAGYAKMQAGDYAGALPLLQQAVQKLAGQGYPNEAYANYNLGYTLLQLGRCAEAVPPLQKAAELEPERHEPRAALKRAQKC